MSKKRYNEDFDFCYTDDYEEEREHNRRERERRERARQKDKRRLEYVKEWNEDKWLNE